MLRTPHRVINFNYDPNTIIGKIRLPKPKWRLPEIINLLSIIYDILASSFIINNVSDRC